MPSRRRRSKKNSSKARRNKRTTRVKKGKGPGTHPNRKSKRTK